MSENKTADAKIKYLVLEQTINRLIAQIKNESLSEEDKEAQTQLATIEDQLKERKELLERQNKETIAHGSGRASEVEFVHSKVNHIRHPHHHAGTMHHSSAYTHPHQVRFDPHYWIPLTFSFLMQIALLFYNKEEYQKTAESRTLQQRLHLWNALFITMALGVASILYLTKTTLAHGVSALGIVAGTPLAPLILAAAHIVRTAFDFISVLTLAVSLIYQIINGKNPDKLYFLKKAFAGSLMSFTFHASMSFLLVVTILTAIGSLSAFGFDFLLGSSAGLAVVIAAPWIVLSVSILSTIYLAPAVFDSLRNWVSSKITPTTSLAGHLKNILIFVAKGLACTIIIALAPFYYIAKLDAVERLRMKLSAIGKKFSTWLFGEPPEQNNSTVNNLASDVMAKGSQSLQSSSQINAIESPKRIDTLLRAITEVAPTTQRTLSTPVGTTTDLSKQRPQSGATTSPAVPMYTNHQHGNGDTVRQTIPQVGTGKSQRPRWNTI